MSLSKVRGFVPVVLAIGGNAFVAVTKFTAAGVSGSSVMFSEAVHSVADTLNQILLLVGLQQSLKKADDRFEYGYGNERFFWALISACGVFFVGAGITAYQGVQALLNPQPIEFSWIIFAVLAVAFVIELYTLYVAAGELKKSFPDATWSERLARADTGTLAVFLEDSVAVIGILVAAVSIGLSYYTGNSAWDGIGSIIIAFLLAYTAVVLIQKNREYLLGKSMPDSVREAVIEMLEKEPAIEKVLDFKSSALGFGIYRIKCEIEFNGVALLREAYRGTTMQEQYDEIDDVEDFKKFTADYADRIPRLMGNKIDEIEKTVRKSFPMIRNIDIEIN